MPERITKTQRWLDLIALLLNRQIPLAVDEIVERVPAYAQTYAAGDETQRASTRRTFERDKDELRAMGIPLESVSYDINYGGEVVEGYRILRKDFYLPYLGVLESEAEPKRKGSPASSAVELEPDEARIALEALDRIAEVPAFPFAAEARSASSKLRFDIDPDLFPSPPVLQVERPGTREVLERLRILSDALLAGKRLRFRYHGIQRNTTTDREVEPYGLFLQRDWYLVARDVERDGIRVFRVSRMDAPTPNTRAPKERDFQVPADFQLSSFVGRRAWELPQEGPVQAEVRFRFPSSLLVARAGEGELVLEEADGAQVRRFSVTDANPFLRWVLGYAGEAEIVSPPALRESYARMAAEVAALYGDQDG